MARNVQVVLTEDLPHVGSTGELVKVKPGYARNFLLPRGLAAMATRDNVKRVEHEKRVAQSRAQKQRAGAQELADQLNKVTISIGRQVGEEEKLYGSVTTRDIQEALAKEGIDIDRRKIMADPLKEIGTHKVSIKVGTGIDAAIQVEIVATET